MHPEALQAVEQMIAASDWETYKVIHGIDVGGQAVNGSARPLFGPRVVWSTLDLYDKTAAHQIDARGIELEGTEPHGYGVVLCTEMLEHVRWWPLVIRTAFSVLDDDGYLFLTAAAPPRHPHSAQGLPEKPADEWYENVNPDELRALVDEVFKPKRVQHTWRENPGDVYLWAQK